MEEENRRREEALAASPALRPNFKSSSVSQEQIKKLLELRKRRLQIKQKSNNQRNSKGGASGVGKACNKELSISDGEDQSAVMAENPNFSTLESTSLMVKETDFLQKDEVEPSSVPKKRKKLYWGLDTKERWERKANM